MKVVFLLDNREYIEATPESLQLRQVSEGVAALGVEVTVPVPLEEGQDPATQTSQVGFRPLINYAIDMKAANVKEVSKLDVEAAHLMNAAVASGEKVKGKAKAAKRKAN
jgi:hypothetical protein